MSEQNTSKKSFLSSDKGKLTAVIAGSVLLIGATFGAQSVASSKPFQHLKLAASDTSAYPGGFQKAGWGGGWGHHKRGKHGGRFANMSDAEMETFVTRMVKHLAIEIDATQDQTSKITVIATSLVKEVRPIRKSMKAARKEAHDLLLKDTIDREALEKLRAGRFAEVDQVSRKVTNALADVAEILSPEQRQKMEKRIKEFRSMGHGRWRRG